LLFVSILAPLIFAVAVPFLFRYMPRIHTGWFVLAVPISLFVFYLSLDLFRVANEPIRQSFPWIAGLDIQITLYLDSLSMLFALLITGIGTLVVLYSIFYMSKEREALHNFYVYLLCFMGAMLGVVLSDNLITLYLFWELTSISSFLLIAYWYQRKRSRYGAVKSLLITVTGGFTMLFGFLMIHSVLGTFSIREIIASADRLAAHPLFLPAMVLILLGALTKSAQFPFHIWLPDAMEAPTPISAYLHSATMVKAGVYLVARLTPVFGGHMEWFWAVTSVGIVTLFWGAFMAIRQTDLKAMLAFSTVSQLGMMMSLFGIGSLALRPGIPHETALLFAGAILAGLFHLFNHSIFKGSLFMVVGILDHELGTRDIRKLGGLIGFMPVSFTLSVIGAFSMAGLPPFSGFLSKEMFFASTLHTVQDLHWRGAWIPLLGWIASVFTFVYSMMLVFRVFGGRHKPEMLDKPSHEAPFGMLVPPTVLAALVVLVFFVPNVPAAAILEPSMRAVLAGLTPPGERFDAHIAAWHGPTPELFMTIGVVVVGILLYRRGWPVLHMLHELLPAKVSLNRAYDWMLSGLEKLSAKVTNAYMTGYLRHYLIYILTAAVVLVGGSLILNRAIVFDFSGNAPIDPFELAVGLAIVACAVFIVFSRSRMKSIIALSAIGFLIALFYVDFRAPDLALTQFVVETISTSLFLLCFYFLPKLKNDVKIPFNPTNLLISLGVGFTMTLVGLSALGNRLFEPIASYFEDVYELAGAKNIVNAILVDFRGFDTMLEIVVLFAAGIGVYTLIKFRQSKRGQP
jgi:multicomponent Na+:H+ antiporter subunit A